MASPAVWNISEVQVDVVDSAPPEEVDEEEKVSMILGCVWEGGSTSSGLNNRVPSVTTLRLGLVLLRVALLLAVPLDPPARSEDRSNMSQGPNTNLRD